MQNDIIDFHTHPFFKSDDNICAHKEFLPEMNADTTFSVMKKLGVAKICGSVISATPKKDGERAWDVVKRNNKTALELRDYYKGFYIPGFHVHPDFVLQSLEEIRDMSARGVKLIGELVPYFHYYDGYAHSGMDEILDYATEKDMIVSFHSMGEDAMDAMVKKHPKTLFVAAHPGEITELLRHVNRALLSKNYYIDLSGYGLFRYGMMRRLISAFGSDRILYGSDYPTCAPAMYLGGVMYDDTITEKERQLILHINAEQLLGIG